MGKKKEDKHKKQKKKKQENKVIKEKKLVIEPENKAVGDDEEVSQEENNTTDNSDSPVAKFFKVIALLGGSGVLAPLLKQLTESLIQISYQNVCEDFYNIPYRYFFVDVEREIITMVIAVLVVVLIFGCSYLLNTSEQKSVLIKMYYYIVEVCLALMFSFVVVLSFFAILKYVKVKSIALPMCFVQIVNEHTHDIILLVVILGIITVFGLNHTSWLKKIENERLKNVMLSIISGIVVISFAIFITAIVLIGKSDVNNKYRYETIQIEDCDYAVLSEIDGKFLIAEYYVDDSKQPYIFTNTYRLIANEDLLIDYVEWELVPKIKKDIGKDDYLNKHLGVDSK